MDKIIEEFPNYSISKLGVIRNLKTGKIIKPYTNWNGYIRIALMKNGKRYSRAVHRLLAQTYISNPNDLPFINHIDGKKDNNSLSNLEWCNKSHNMRHAHRLGLVKKKTGAEGSNNGSSKLTEEDVLAIRKLASENVSSKEIAEQFNISRGNCNSIIARKYWKHI